MGDKIKRVIVLMLESMANEEASVVVSRGRAILSNAQSQIDVAIDRFESFLGIQKGRTA